MLLELPADVLMSIIERVDAQSSEALASVCRSLHAIMTRTGTPPQPLSTRSCGHALPLVVSTMRHMLIDTAVDRAFRVYGVRQLRCMGSQRHRTETAGGSNSLRRTCQTGHRWRRLEVQVTLQGHLWPAEVRQVRPRWSTP